MSELHSFGEWLRQHRRNRDLTQAELAALVGCALGTLRNIETDSARPSKHLAARLANSLGVPKAESNSMVEFARGVGEAPARTIVAPTLPTRLSPMAVPQPTPQPTRFKLPAQLSGLIGRTDVVEAVRALLLRPDVRLVTLSGPGGAGKTRVAAQVAIELQDTLANGAVFVDLSEVRDAHLVWVKLAQTLAAAEGNRRLLPNQFVDALRNQELLLLLDNFEQIIEAAPVVTTILEACPNIKALVTSRIALGLSGEYEWPVRPLALPDRTNMPPFEQLSQYEAVRLFSERARAANPQFVITTSNAPAVAEICYQLDGLPLTIELAATRSRLFEPQALLARLDKRLTFLAGGRDRPIRQQTIRNSIAWSYQLLSADEQTLFRRLSVFVGGVTLAAIEAVCTGDNRAHDIVGPVSALVSQSLLYTLPEVDDYLDAEPRFGMLQTTHEYACEQLANSPDAEIVSQRHAEYYTALAETTADCPTAQFDAAIALQRRELDNMRTALQWALDTHNSALGLRLAGALWEFWRSNGLLDEGRTWLKQLLALDVHPTDQAAMTTRRNAPPGFDDVARDIGDGVYAYSLNSPFKPA